MYHVMLQTQISLTIYVSLSLSVSLFLSSSLSLSLSLGIRPNNPLLLASLLDYIMCLYGAVIVKFPLVIQRLHIHVKSL